MSLQHYTPAEQERFVSSNGALPHSGRRLAIIAALVATTALLAGPASAKPVAYFAGFALRGAAASLKERFPYSYAMTSRSISGVDQIDEVLRQDLSAVRPDNFTLDVGNLGNLLQGQTTAVAFVLNRETVGQEQISGIHKLYIQLSGSVLFFDFDGMRVVATYPVSVEYIDAFDAAPTHEEIAKDVQEIYFGDLKVNILRAYIQALQAAVLKPTLGNTLRLTSVTVAPSAIGELAPALQLRPTDAQQYVAEAFDKALVANQHVSVLPYAKDAAIGNTMALRFANGTIYNLLIPQADYAIQLTVTGFRKIQYEKTPVGSGWIYAAYAKFKLYEPLSNHVYIDAAFRDGVVKVVPADESTLMDWPVYQEALLTLFDHLTDALSEPNSAWAEKATGNPAITNDLINVRDVLQSCH